MKIQQCRLLRWHSRKAISKLFFRVRLQITILVEYQNKAFDAVWLIKLERNAVVSGKYTLQKVANAAKIP